jgi:hypothetical protein
VHLVRFAYFPSLATISALHLARYKNLCHFERSEESLFSWIRNKERFLASLGMTNKSPIPQPYSDLAVRQHLVNIARVGRMNLLQLFQAAHTVRFLCAEQVPLAGVHAHYFSGGSNLKPLRGSAMRLELQFLYLLFCHRGFLSKIFPRRTGFSLSDFGLSLHNKET